jgi:hypothetical protein
VSTRHRRLLRRDLRQFLRQKTRTQHPLRHRRWARRHSLFLHRRLLLRRRHRLASTNCAISLGLKTKPAVFRSLDQREFARAACAWQMHPTPLNARVISAPSNDRACLATAARVHVWPSHRILCGRKAVFLRQHRRPRLRRLRSSARELSAVCPAMPMRPVESSTRHWVQLAPLVVANSFRRSVRLETLWSTVRVHSATTCQMERSAALATVVAERSSLVRCVCETACSRQLRPR